MRQEFGGDHIGAAPDGGRYRGQADIREGTGFYLHLKYLYFKINQHSIDYLDVKMNAAYQTGMAEDHVDRILAQWTRERPDLDIGPMGLLGRLARLSTYLGREVEKTFSQFGLSSASFDVLAALRRSGPPYRLSPGDLLSTTMITSGTMTNRIDQLEKAGLVERLTNPEDRRSVLIALKPEGLALVERTVTAHVANQHRLTALLEPDERAALDRIARKYLAAFE